MGILPIELRRRLNFENLKEDVDSLIYDWDICEYFDNHSDFISEVCDLIKDRLLEDVGIPVSAKSRDSLYWFLINSLEKYLYKIYRNCVK